LYQYLINSSDVDVIKYLKYFTFLPSEEISGYLDSIQNEPEQRRAQRRLAEEVTSLVHGAENAALARKASEVLFGGEVADLTDSLLEEIFPDVPRADLASADLSKGVEITQVLLSCRAVASKGEARRLISGGGVYVNNRKVADVQYKLTACDLASEHFILMRTGKKRFFLLRSV
jgi:tyrosyl-tRNA synthetase